MSNAADGLTLGEVGEILGVATNTVYSWVRHGANRRSGGEGLVKLPGYKNGRPMRVKASHLRAFLRASTAKVARADAEREISAAIKREASLASPHLEPEYHI